MNSWFKKGNLFLRATLFIFLQILSAMFFALTGLLCFACPFTFRYRLITLWSHFTIWAAKTFCGINYQVIGLENLPKNNAIALVKHQSAWETLFLQTLLPYQSWVLKKQLLNIPFFGWGLSLLEPIAIDRSKTSSIKQLLEQGEKRLKQGRWVVIFPEGSRMNVGKTGRYSRSGAVLAKETGYKIVPIAHNAGICWPKKAFLKKPGIITVVIGPPLDPKDYSVEELQKKTQEWIEETSNRLIPR